MLTKLLVANRGEIACRVIRTARRMGIATVAVYSDADRTALHVELADEAVALGGLSPADSYLRTDALLAAARRTGVDAVHPGYGFLSEQAGFAQACADAGLVFVGPPPAAIAAMGDKLRAKELMRGAGVPVLDRFAEDDVPDGAYPVIVKAAMGGGGKGMRVVEAPGGLADALAAARRESAAAFGDDTVFVEPYLTRPRHVEVQILGDAHGTVVHLGERECSIQRRHQKVIEESPSPAVDAALRAQMGAAAVTAAEAIGYANAGTVEFILDAGGQFHFLEVNTRLQVEHPVTELAWTVGDGPLDLVELQLRVAAGEPLPFAQDDVHLRGHAIEARLYAEDPANDFLPAAGPLEAFEITADDVRVDTGVRSGDEISVHYDPMIAKVIAAGATRQDAARRLARALEQARLHGISTNRDFLVASLRHPAFEAGDTTTGFIDEHLPADVRRTRPTDDALRAHAVAAALAASRRRLRGRRVLATVPGGWRNNPSQPQQVIYDCGGEQVAVGYRSTGPGRYVAHLGEDEMDVRVLGWPDERGDGQLDLELGGHRLRAHVVDRAPVWLVDSPLGHTRLVEEPRFPDLRAQDAAGGLFAPMPGTVVEVGISTGDDVDEGALLLVLEAMKMEHRITAPHAGTVSEVRVTAGDRVDAGAVLVVVDERS
jgi:propionyl-CoA carboxylase alpha chain